jgi:hypothetical protein
MVVIDQIAQSTGISSCVQKYPFRGRDSSPQTSSLLNP